MWNPRRLGSWLMAMTRAAALVKPASTGEEMKRTRPPSLAMPITVTITCVRDKQAGG